MTRCVRQQPVGRPEVSDFGKKPTVFWKPLIDANQRLSDWRSNDSFLVD